MSPAAARRRSAWPVPSAYDAIVLDVILPGIDGFETCRRLRARGGLVAGADADRARRARGPGRRASTAAPTTT